MYSIFIVEDDLTLSKQLESTLTKWGFDPYIANDFQHIDQSFELHPCNLIIMDVELPCFDGFYWCRKLRTYTDVPILFLSCRSKDTDQIMGMTLGGDDYLCKPLHPEILIAKINALLRRSYGYNINTSNYNSTLTSGDLIFDMNSSIIRYKEATVELTRNEHKILAELMKHAGKILPREKLMDALWNNNVYVNDNTLTVNVNRLRAKLKDLCSSNPIKTKKGQGYLFDDKTLRS